ncbi:LTA synthase family protein [Paenibacillus agricola]|uniref:LTA synthase family protein n=1 Tax=Paenibacillus agricola TaxID=2716264 RepID=A0ABX0J0W8_9BACL|nr:LTA synthase family protein [Paenibacillus agricola]NHN29086.1 LTA synthase family protein [Paenibacillus agricola]
MGELQFVVKNAGWKAAKRLPFVLLSFWIVLLVELMSRGQWGDSLGWPFRALPELLLNIVLVLSLLFLVTAITGKLHISFWLVSTTCLVFAAISGIKLAILGVPFLPWDLLLTDETKDVAPYITGFFNFTVLSGLTTFIAISIFLLYKLPWFALILNWKHRTIMGIASALLIGSLYTDEALSLKNLTNVQNLAWDQAENVRANGFLLSTIMNLKFLYLDKPDSYDNASIQAVSSSIVPAVADAGEIKPNIIIVLSESFWDATQAKGLTFSRDPLPFYHEMIQTYSSGSLLSPQFGGGTANVEFEVLTGNSMRFLPQGSIPYNQYVNKEIDSLGSILTRQGYLATAISPFHSWFYNSKKVYENFGFANYIPQEFFKPDYEGPYLADREVANEIIETSTNSEGADFIYANTMQNHYHYYPGKFKENTIEITGVTGESKGLLETYAQGLVDVDAMLKRLVEHYENLNEPTILVFFGDHKPSLGQDYKAYKDIGFLKENDPDFLNKMYRVPILVWNNYLPKEKESLDMSPSFLGPYLLKLSQRTGSYFTDYLYQLSQSMPVIPPENHYAEMKINKDNLNLYKKLQYDIIFGEQYGYNSMKNKIKNHDYTLGSGRMVISQLRTEAFKDGKLLKIVGSDLPPNSIVRINGQQMATNWISKNELTAEIQPTLMNKFPWNVEIIVKDSKDKVLAKSNEYVYLGEL